MKQRSFTEIAADISAEVTKKNGAYGNSVGKSGDVLRILYPNGIQPEQYDDLQLVTRIIDKLFRIATDKDALGESPYRDMAGYGILGMAKDEAAVLAEAADIAQGIVSDAVQRHSPFFRDDGYYYLNIGDLITGDVEMYVLGGWAPVRGDRIIGQTRKDYHLKMRRKIQQEEGDGYHYLKDGDVISTDVQIYYSGGQWHAIASDNPAVGSIYSSQHNRKMRRKILE